MRRARERDGGGSRRVPRADDDVTRRNRGEHHEADDAGGQHVQHARRRERGVHLHRHHPRRVLPRPGVQHLHDGRLHVAMGGGFARDLRAPGRDARGLGLSGVFGRQAGELLRAGGAGAVPGLPGPRGLRHHRRRGVTPGGRLFGSRHVRDVGHRAGVLGLGQEAGAAQALPVRQLAHLVQQVQQRAGTLLREDRPGVSQPEGEGSRGSAKGGRAQRDCAARRQGFAGGVGQDHPRDGQVPEGGFPAAELVHRLRQVLSLLQVRRDAPKHRQVSRLRKRRGGKDGKRRRRQDHLQRRPRADGRPDVQDRESEVRGSGDGGGGGDAQAGRARARPGGGVPAARGRVQVRTRANGGIVSFVPPAGRRDADKRELDDVE
mmetsp:Transcript_9720/g.37952  ORF Transcript_9720/g.37952 Transcript_9720/m.37952 type:complete len:376 (+) Transcript_9720:313-1440(+)